MPVQKPKTLGTRVEEEVYLKITTHALAKEMRVADWVTDAIKEKYVRETLLTGKPFFMNSSLQESNATKKNVYDAPELSNFQKDLKERFIKANEISRMLDSLLLVSIILFSKDRH